MSSGPAPSQIAYPEPHSPRRPVPANHTSQPPLHGSPRANGSTGGAFRAGPSDIEGLLRAHGGDINKALEAVLVERSSLVSRV